MRSASSRILSRWKVINLGGKSNVPKWTRRQIQAAAGQREEGVKYAKSVVDDITAFDQFKAKSKNKSVFFSSGGSTKLKFDSMINL